MTRLPANTPPFDYKERSALFNRCFLELDPMVIQRRTYLRDDTGMVTTWDEERKPGRFYRVIPHSWRDILFLQALETGTDKWHAAHGDGVIVVAHFIDDIDPDLV